MKRLRKFLSLTPSDRRLLVGTVLLLGAIRLILWLLPFQSWRSLLASMARPKAECQEVEQTSLDKIIWAVTVASRYMPGVKCLASALTTQVLLAQQCYVSDLRIGVAKSEEGQLEAHAWVESQERIMIGGLADLSRYTPLPSLKREGL